MIVIIASHLPDAIRGILKRWFIEPRPNVFVGTINERIKRKIIEYIKRNSSGVSMLIIASDNTNCQGFAIEQQGVADRKCAIKSGLLLVSQKY